MPDLSVPATIAARLDAAATALGHRFGDASLLERACTHASRCGAQASDRQRLEQANERLEFLGDALLGAGLCLLLYRRHPDADEGQLSRVKSRLASRQTLARLIEQAGLLPHCLVGAQMSEPWPDSVKANLAESLLAAVFLDGGWNALLTAVERLFASQLEDADIDREDAKTALQAWCLEHHGQLPIYVSARDGGPDHDPQFSATVEIGGLRGHGRGSSRRRAETAAAADLRKVLSDQR